jgi:magnesium-transporting ATPase (P-type)
MSTAGLKGASEKKDMKKLMNKVKGTELKVGDIVQLMQGEVAPCDILILNTSELVQNRYICMVDSWFANGTIKSEIKYAVSVTRQFGKLFAKQDSLIFQALNRLSGTIEYWPFTVSDSFKGTFKLKSDPKIEDLSNENLIRKGSVIHTQYVTGIALFCGSTSLYFYDTFHNLRSKSSTISKKIHWYAVSTIVINLTFSVISTMTLMIKSRGLQVVEDLDVHVNDGYKFISFLVLYSPIQPLFVVTLCNVVNFLQAWLLERKYKKFLPEQSDHFQKYKSFFKYPDEKRSSDVDLVSEQLQDKNLAVINPYTLPNLGSICDVFLDKTGTLANSNFEVFTFATSKKTYKSSTNNFRVGGMVNIKADKLNEGEGNDSERSFEGFDTQIFREGARTGKDGNEDFNVYDFGTRKVLANPFAEMNKMMGSMQSLMDLTGFDGQDDTKKSSTNLVMQQNEKFFQSSSPYRKQEGYTAFKLHSTEDNSERQFDEIEFMTDTKTDRELKTILQMFTLCHNARVRGDE